MPAGAAPRPAAESPVPPSRKFSPAHPVTVVIWGRGSGSSSAASGSGAADTPAVGDDPVVGWLVAIDGPAKGKDFRVFCGNNSVGRDPACRIYIQEDRAIHRGIHTTIVYDPEENGYHIVPNALVKSLVRVERPSVGNKDLLLQPVPLEPFSIIHMGASQLMFVPFCNELFKWDLQ